MILMNVEERFSINLIFTLMAKYMVYVRKVDGTTEPFGRRTTLRSAMHTIESMTRMIKQWNTNHALYYYCLPIDEKD